MKNKYYEELYNLIEKGPILCGCVFYTNDEGLTLSKEVRLQHGPIGCVKVYQNLEKDYGFPLRDVKELDGEKYNIPHLKALAYVTGRAARKLTWPKSVTIVTKTHVIEATVCDPVIPTIDRTTEKEAMIEIYDLLESLEAGSGIYEMKRVQMVVTERNTNKEIRNI